MLECPSWAKSSLVSGFVKMSISKAHNSRSERFEENGAMYHWPGVKGADIVSECSGVLISTYLTALFNTAYGEGSGAERGSIADGSAQGCRVW